MPTKYYGMYGSLICIMWKFGNRFLFFKDNNCNEDRYICCVIFKFNTFFMFLAGNASHKTVPFITVLPLRLKRKQRCNDKILKYGLNLLFRSKDKPQIYKPLCPVFNSIYWLHVLLKRDSKMRIQNVEYHENSFCNFIYKICFFASILMIKKMLVNV